MFHYFQYALCSDNFFVSISCVTLIFSIYCVPLMFSIHCNSTLFSFFLIFLVFHSLCSVHAGSPSRGGDVAGDVFDINQLSLPTPLYSVLVSVSLFMALSTVFHSINSPYNSPLSDSVLPVLFLPYRSFHIHIFLYESLPQP